MALEECVCVRVCECVCVCVLMCECVCCVGGGRGDLSWWVSHLNSPEPHTPVACVLPNKRQVHVGVCGSECVSTHSFFWPVKITVVMHQLFLHDEKCVRVGQFLCSLENLCRHISVSVLFLPVFDPLVKTW